jgi:hypothetical protein
MVGGKTFSNTRLLQGTSTAVLWAEPPADKLPKGIKVTAALAAMIY